MITTFETFRQVDSESGVETWKAYLGRDCSWNDDLNEYAPRQNAPVGIGDSELEAIAELCIKVQENTERKQAAQEKEERLFAARMAPMTIEEVEYLEILVTESNNIWFVDPSIAGKLVDKGYATCDRFFRPTSYRITIEGRDWYFHYFDQQTKEISE
jgi:hypothetical protein